MAKTNQSKLEKKEELKKKRQLNMERGKGITQGKKLGMRKGIWLSILTVLTLGIIGTGSYISVLAFQTQNINLTTEIKTTDLGTIFIKNADNGASKSQILSALIAKNGDTAKSVYDYKVTDIKYDKASLSGSAEIRSTNWLSKQEIKVTYKVQVQ